MTSMYLSDILMISLFRISRHHFISIHFQANLSKAVFIFHSAILVATSFSFVHLKHSNKCYYIGLVTVITSVIFKPDLTLEITFMVALQIELVRLTDH